MAQPIPLEIPPRNPRAELQSRLENAPEEHAEAVLAAYEVLEELHNRGVLEIMRGVPWRRTTKFWRRCSTMQKRPKPFGQLEIFSSGFAFSEASSRNGSRVSSRPFP